MDRVTIKTFENNGNGIEVTGIPGKPATWSLNFYTKLSNGGSGRFLKPGLKVENAKATVETPGMAFSRLIDEACLFVQEAAQEDADRYIDRRIRREERGTKEVAKVTGLGRFSAKATEEQRAAERLKREQNAAARRNRDAEQRSKMRGK